MASVPEQLATLQRDVTSLRRELGEISQRQTDFARRHTEIVTEAASLFDDVRLVLKMHAEDETHTGDQYRERTAEPRVRIAARVDRLRALTAEASRELSTS